MGQSEKVKTGRTELRLKYQGNKETYGLFQPKNIFRELYLLILTTETQSCRLISCTVQYCLHPKMSLLQLIQELLGWSLTSSTLLTGQHKTVKACIQYSSRL